MVYSFVFLGERNRKKILEEITSKVNISSGSYQILFLTNKEPKQENLSNEFRHTNFKTIIFKESATNEQMFETLIHNENLGTVVLFKETIKEINFSNINRMLELNSRGAKVVVSKQNKNENIFSKVYEKIKHFFARIFLGVKLYPGEGDVILLDSVLTATLSEMNGKSALLTKVNGWVGVEPKSVVINAQPKQKKQHNLKQFLFPGIWLLLFFGMILGNILFAVLNVKLPFLGMFAYIVVEIALFGVFLYTLSRTMFNYYYGNINYTIESEIVKIIDNLDE